MLDTLQWTWLFGLAMANPAPHAFERVGADLGHACYVRGAKAHRLVCLTRDTPLPASEGAHFTHVELLDADSLATLWRHPLALETTPRQVEVDAADQVWLDTYGALRRIHPSDGVGGPPWSLPEDSYVESDEIRLLRSPGGRLGISFRGTLWVVEKGSPKPWFKTDSGVVQAFDLKAGEVWVTSEEGVEVRAKNGRVHQRFAEASLPRVVDISADGRWAAIAAFSELRVVDRSDGSVVWKREAQEGGHYGMSGCFGAGRWWHADGATSPGTPEMSMLYGWSLPDRAPTAVRSPQPAYWRSPLCLGDWVVSVEPLAMEQGPTVHGPTATARPRAFTPVLHDARWTDVELVATANEDGPSLRWARSTPAPSPTLIGQGELLPATDDLRPAWYTLPSTKTAAGEPKTTLPDGTELVTESDGDSHTVRLERDGKVVWRHAFGAVYSSYLMRVTDQVLLFKLESADKPTTVALDRATGKETGHLMLPENHGYHADGYAIIGDRLYLSWDGGHVSSHRLPGLETLWSERAHVRQPELRVREGQLVSIEGSAVFWQP